MESVDPTVGPLPSDETPLLEAALNYARRGWRVLPLESVDGNGACSCGRATCKPGGSNEKSVAKHPRIPDWQNAATTDKATIEAWWERWPTANVGIATGAASDLLVLDVDVHRDKPGFKSLEALVAELGEPSTLRCFTGSGGMHAYFRAPDLAVRNSTDWRDREGIDWRGEGGQVVAPPSVALAGRYRWEDGPSAVADLPGTWLDAHREHEVRREAPAAVRLPETPPTPEELAEDDRVLERARAARNATKFGTLWSGDWPSLGYDSQSSADLALCTMLAFWSPDAARIDRLVRRSGLMRDKWERADYAERTIAAALHTDETRRADDTRFKETFADAGWKLAATPSPTPTAPATASTLPLVRVGDIPDPGPAKWLVEGLWSDGAFGIIGAEPKSWKSWLTLQLAICVAAGKKAFDRLAVRRGRVIVFSAEGGKGLVRSRAIALCRALDVDIKTLDLEVVDVPALQLDNAEGVKLLWSIVEQRRPVLVVLDPLREMHAGDENDSAAIARLLLPLRTMQRELGCAIMLVHHMTKVSAEGGGRRLGQRLRGSSALHGAVDSALYLEPKGEGPAKRVKVTAEHRGAAEPEPLTLILRDALSMGGKSTWLEPVQPADEDREQVAANVQMREKNRGRVLAAIRLSCSPGNTPLRSKSAVALAAGGRKGMMLAVLDDLIKDGTVVINGDGTFQPTLGVRQTVPGGSR